ncbi:hypothetical protein OIV83_003976 [Microbotryomycetes sp. JL201]|nr:hypothetical protein OIV83_003976 [Microbotryomycetes sp. JL201]
MTSIQKDNQRVLVLDHLADIENKVYMHCRSQDVRDSLNQHHKNPNPKPNKSIYSNRHCKIDHVFPDNLEAIGPDLPDSEFLSSIDVLVFAVPTQSARSVLAKLNLQNVEPLPLLVFVNKGIETSSGKLPLEVIEEVCGSKIADVATFLSGPSFAKEIVKRQPTQVSVASRSIEHATKTGELFHQPHFRCYLNPDPIGIEASLELLSRIAGALKNVYAVASGVASGLGFEANASFSSNQKSSTRAGLVTRSLAEMTRVGVAYNADPMTFLSLAGVGDLFLTCSSEKSRNFTVGYRLGKGETLDHILQTLGSVAEGVDTTKAAFKLVKDKQLDAPILIEVWEMLWNGRPAKECAQRLMNLPMRTEEQYITSR